MCAVRRYNNGTSVFQQNMHNLASHCKFVGEVGTARAFKETIRSNFEFMDHIKKTKGECKPVFVATGPSETGQPDRPEVHLGVLISWLGSGRKCNLVRVRKRCCYGFKYLFWWLQTWQARLQMLKTVLTGLLAFLPVTPPASPAPPHTKSQVINV